MPYALLDDGILDHPKVAKVGPLGFALFTASIVYANRNLTDGFVPYGVAYRLLPFTWTHSERQVWTVAVSSGMLGLDTDETVEHCVELLLDSGLWEVVPHGYQIHDFLDWNLSRSEREAKREALQAKRREAGRLGGQATALARRKQTGSKPRSKLVAKVQPPSTTTTKEVQEPPLPPQGGVNGNGTKNLESAHVQAVFEYWRTARDHPNAKLGEDRKRKIRGRLREGFTVEELCLAVDGVALDPWEDRGRHDGIEVVFRNGSQVEKFLGLHADLTVLSAEERKQRHLASLREQGLIA